MARICQRCQHNNEDHAKFCLSCGAMLEVVEENQADPLIGKVLMGRYRPTKLLGEGGMGRVYLAEQKMGAAVRKVAIKTLHPELSQDPQLVARFHRESETVIELSHPNTIQFYDFGELEDGTLFIVMEYIEGRALAAEMEKGRLDVGRIDKILIQTCGSLHEAHGRGVVHRDLKPDNVLLTDRGGQTDFVKVLDFGIAKKGDAEDPQKQKLTKQGMVLGTPPYMSPEQFSGKALDARSDIYSLGVMVYEMLTGQLPFEAKTPWEWATKHLTSQPAPFEAHPGGAALPQNKKNAVMRALSKDREQRQATVLDFLQEFTGYQDAQAAWTMATSSGGGAMPSSSPGMARPPAPTPGPMSQFGANTPPPNLYGGPGMPPGSTIPGAHVPSQPGFGASSPVPGTQQFGGAYPSGQQPYASNPGMSVPGAYPGYPSGAMAQPRSSGGMGKILIVLVLLLFVAGGGVAGAAIYLLAGSDPVATTGATTGTGATGNGTVGQPPNEPMQPMQPMLPTTPTTPSTPTPPIPTAVPDAGVQVASTETETETETEERAPSKRGPSAADESRARSLVAQGMTAAQRNDFRAAIGFMREAQRAVGRRSAITRPLQDELDRRGGNQILALLQGGRCPQAQALFRDLRGVGATAGQRYFDPSWCPRP